MGGLDEGSFSQHKYQINRRTNSRIRIQVVILKFQAVSKYGTVPYKSFMRQFIESSNKTKMRLKLNKIQFGKRAGDQMLFFLENFYEAIKKRACDQTCLKTAKNHNSIRK